MDGTVFGVSRLTDLIHTLSSKPFKVQFLSKSLPKKTFFSNAMQTYCVVMA